MVCPNCHSHEIISVQGQNFCISCGQILPDTESEKVLAAVGAQLTETGQAIIKGVPVPATAAVTAAPATVKPKKRPVGRPKQERMDAPITHLPPTSPPAVKPQADPEVPAKPLSLKPKSKPGKPVEPAPASAPKITPAKPRLITDVRTKTAETAPEPRPPSHAKTGLWAASWQALGHALNYVQALPLVIVALLPLGIVWQNFSVLAGLGLRRPTVSELAVLGQLILAAIVVITVGLISVSAIIYGSARRHDNRGGSGLTWAHVGALANRKAWGVVLWQLLISLPTLAALAALIKFGSLDLALPSYVSLVAVFLTSVAAGYILLGVLMAGLIGIAGVTLGNLKVWPAVHLGWNGWRRHFELLGSWFAARLLIAVLAAAWAFSLWPLNISGLTARIWLAKAAGGCLLLLLILVVQTGAIAEAGYRHVVTADRFGQAGSFLMGRKAKGVSKFAAFPLALTLLAAAGIAALQLTILR